ncbi:hypothetical protein BX616_003079 [Lobosporangium transversale]|nr:hypothetical protein BX616_003079 [Lobosporangium transversale]
MIPLNPSLSILEIMAANREKRANAGNRLLALLNEEEEMEELFDDEGVDEEFEVEGYEEEDIVDSDFDQSSADEEPEEDEEANLGEDPEEAKARKKQQSMLQHLKTGKSAFSLPGATTTPSAKGGRVKERGQATSSSKKDTTPILASESSKRATSTASSNTSAAASPAPSGSTTASTMNIKIPAEIRKSSRRTTVLNNQETELKLLEYETRKAMQPKREKAVVHKMTQEELLEEAKKTEAINLASLRAFKAQELEKKKVVKKKEVVMQSFVRYHSFAEWIGHGPLIKALAEIGAATPGGGTTRVGSRAGSRAGSVAPEALPTQYGSTGGIPPHNLAQSLAQSLLLQQQIQAQQEQQAPTSTSTSTSVKSRPISRHPSPGPEGRQLKIDLNTVDNSEHKAPSSPMNVDISRSTVGDVEMSSPAEDQDRRGAGASGGTLGESIPTGAMTPAHWATMNMSVGSIARKRKKLHPSQMCGRNWITFVGYEDEDSPINEWSYVESYPERKPICQITGLPAKYRDPKTGIPYANKEAYKILQNVIHHGYVWSNGLNAYCHDVAQPLPKGVPAGLAEALIGGQQVGEGIVLKDGDLVSAGIPGGGGGGYTYRRRQQMQKQAQD